MAVQLRPHSKMDCDAIMRELKTDSYAHIAGVTIESHIRDSALTDGNIRHALGG